MGRARMRRTRPEGQQWHPKPQAGRRNDERQKKEKPAVKAGFSVSDSRLVLFRRAQDWVGGRGYRVPGQDTRELRLV